MSVLTALHRLGPADMIPLGEGRVFRIGDREIAVFRSRSGETFASDAACPHRGGPLADGIVTRDCVVCPLHGMAFNLRDGKPRGGDGCPPLETFRVVTDVSGDLILELP